MIAGRDARQIQIQVERAWTGVRAAVAQMYSTTEIRPDDATIVFRPEPSSTGEPQVSAGPVVFRVPERASKRDANLYIVVKGWISFAPILEPPSLTTQRFGTNVGYFRAKPDRLDHVYGVHYDMEEEQPCHPVFHAQISSQASLASVVRENFTVPSDECDIAAGLLKNVRTPTAQMDVFSLITQIGADHLVYEGSSAEVRDAFIRLRTACDFFVGAAGRLVYLHEDSAAHCYRSTHWYDRQGA